MHSIIDKELQFYELRSDGVIESGNICIKNKTHALKIDGKYTKISNCCFKILAYLVKNKGKTVTMIDLYKTYALYQPGMIIEPVIGVHMINIRRIIGKERIEVVYKFGYKFIE